MFAFCQESRVPAHLRALSPTAIGMILLNAAIIALELRVEALQQIHPKKDEDCPAEKIKCNPGFERHLASSQLCLISKMRKILREVSYIAIV